MVYIAPSGHMDKDILCKVGSKRSRRVKVGSNGDSQMQTGNEFANSGSVKHVKL